MKNLMKAALTMTMAAMVFAVSGQPRQMDGRQRDGQPQQRERMTPEQMVTNQVDQMVKEFQLNDTQKAELKTLIENQQKARQANRKEGVKPSMEERKAQMEKMQNDFDAGVKKIMTADQYKKYQDKQAARKKQMEERMKNMQEKVAGTEKQ